MPEPVGRPRSSALGFRYCRAQFARPQSARRKAIAADAKLFAIGDAPKILKSIYHEPMPSRSTPPRAALWAALLVAAGCTKVSNGGTLQDHDAANTGMRDARTSDASVTDARTSDASVTDARTSDASVTDARTSDASVTDARTSDASVTDARTSDASVTDARTSDASHEGAPNGGSNYYVSTAGSDSSGNGSQSSPWATISHAASQLLPGATVHVEAGNYTRGVSTSTSGTSNAYITYEGDNASWQPVDCARIAANHGDLSQCPHLLNGWDNSGDYVEIEGFDVTGSGINGIYTQGNATIITENHVHDMLPSTCNSTGGSGINLNGTNAQVTDNYVHNIGPYPSSCGFVQGIYFLQAGGFAYNNISFNNSGFGIQLWHYPANIALVNNTIFNNASGGIVMGTDNNFTVDYIVVSNNIVVYNGGAGISEQGCCSTSVGSHITVTNNLLYQNSSPSTSLQGGPLGSLTIGLNPQFVDYTGSASGNYHLQPNSPARGTGTGSGSPATDFDGNARPQNGKYDIGAYEYVP